MIIPSKILKILIVFHTNKIMPPKKLPSKKDDFNTLTIPERKI